jgi:hypothetical protein
MMTERQMNLAEALSKLYGEPLSSITFVEDYLQLGFTAGRITMVVNPRLVANGKEYRWDSPEFCTKLRAQIGVAVNGAEVTDAGVTLVMASGIRLAAVFSDEPRLVERFIFTNDSGTNWIV